MSIGDKPAFPGEYQTLSEDGQNIVIRQCPGLTKRELFVALIAAGSTRDKAAWSHRPRAEWTIEYADNLIMLLDDEAERK